MDNNLFNLKRLYEGPQQDAYGVTLSQQLDQPGCAEKLQETHVDGVHRLGWTAQDGWREGDAEQRGRAADKGGRGCKTQMVKFTTRHDLSLPGSRDCNTGGDLEQKNATFQRSY